jgi:hypothetical protein
MIAQHLAPMHSSSVSIADKLKHRYACSRVGMRWPVISARIPGIKEPSCQVRSAAKGPRSFVERGGG